MLWTTRNLFTSLGEIKIIPKIFSDHGILEFHIGYKTPSITWKLKEELIRKPEDIEKYRKALKEYFEFNCIPELPNSIVWDASKAVLRALLIQHGFINRKAKQKKEKELLLKIKEADSNLKKKPSNNLFIYL